MNLLINLKKIRFFDASIAGNLLLLLSFISGSVLFWLFGLPVFKSGFLDFSEFNFCIALLATLVLIVFSAFSQLGIMLVAVFDAAFEFLISCFVFRGLADNSDIYSVAVLCFQVFVMAALAILCSQKSIKASLGILRYTVVSKKCAADFAYNIFVLIALIIVLLIICLNAF